MFLMGPMKQLGTMFDKGRIVATCAYLASLGLTLFAALWVSPKLSSPPLSAPLLSPPLPSPPLLGSNWQSMQDAQGRC